MCFFKKKKNLAKKNNEDRALIESNSLAINALMILSEDKEFNKSLLKLQEEIKYLIPSTQDKIYSFDKKIQHLIEDLKIVLTKNGVPELKANNILKEIRVLIADRNSNM